MDKKKSTKLKGIISKLTNVALRSVDRTDNSQKIQKPFNSTENFKSPYTAAQFNQNLRTAKVIR